MALIQQLFHWLNSCLLGCVAGTIWIMSGNNEQLKIVKGLKDSLQELQILRFFTTLAVLTIIFVLVLRFVQQTSVSSDKIKPAEAAFTPTSIDSMLDFAPPKTQNNLTKQDADSKK